MRRKSAPIAPRVVSFRNPVAMFFSIVPMNRTHARGFAIGLAATAVLLTLYLSGSLRDFEDWAYDQRMRHFNTLTETDRIVHIDLTDQTFDLIAPWPWPRRLSGDLIRTLSELGAENIVFDIEFKRHKDARDVDGVRVDDDAELGAAIAAAGNVFVPLSFKSLPPGVSRERARARAREILAADPEVPDAEFRDRLGSFDVFGESGLLRFQLGELLRAEFWLDSAELADRIGADDKRVSDVLAGIKHAVARERVAAQLESLPEQSFDELVVALCGVPSAEEAEPEDRRAIDLARDWHENTRTILKFAEPAPEGDDELLPTAVALQPPIADIGEFAVGMGFVSFEGERNVVRHTALLVRYGDRVIPHLGLAVACRLAGIDLGDIRLTPTGNLEMPHPADPSRTLRIRLDDRGRALINWSDGDDDSAIREAAWLGSFDHIPAARIMEIPVFRREIERNRLLHEQLKHRLVERFDPVSALAYEDDLNEMRSLRLSPPSPENEARQREIAQALQEIDKRVLDKLVFWYQEIDGAQPQSEEERIDFDLIRHGHADLVEGEFLERTGNLKTQYESDIQERIEQLGPLIKGKTCLIGYTASAVADMKPTPVYDIAPGVMVYSNIINQILAGRMPHFAPRWINVTAIVVAGIVVAWVAATMSAVSSVVLMLLLNLVYVGINAGVIYRRYDLFLSLVGPALTMAGVWAAVTVYRQLTEERQRRRFSRALAQYVSPAVANRLSQQTDQLDLSPVAREVTCFFSDLKGFTTLSERLGAEQTRAVLNPYLEAMSQVLHEYDAMINKFMGDGIFAFFNAPIFVCPNHAERACGSALACFEALETLKANPPAGAPASEMSALSMRVGMATGTVFVGDYGSATKLDYTAIGDSVNLGARLEPANKVFGTRIALAERTRELAGDGYVFRRLGLVRVMGKTEGVGVYELLGRRDEVNGSQLEHVEHFERALSAYCHRDFAAARSGFERCLSARADDLCAREYLQMIEALEANPPGDEWQGILELTSK